MPATRDKYGRRTDCKSCGHHVSVHRYVGLGPPGPCINCDCQKYVRPQKGERSVKPTTKETTK